MFPLSQGDTVDYQKQLKQMIKDLAKEKDKTEKELPKMSQVWTVFRAEESPLCRVTGSDVGF